MTKERRSLLGSHPKRNVLGAVFQRYPPMNCFAKRPLHVLVFVCALHLIANLLEEEDIFARLTPSAIAIASCPTFVGYDLRTSRRALRQWNLFGLGKPADMCVVS